MRDSNGRFLPGNTFARGYGAPLGNGNARGAGAPARNTNAVKTGEFMRFEEDEMPYDRLRGGKSEHRRWCINAGYIQVRRELAAERRRLKAAFSQRVF